MSSLVLYEDRPGRSEKLAAFLKPRAGSYHDIAIDAVPGFRLAWWTAETATTAFYLPLGGTDFVAVAGSFFYDGRFGEDAARAFQADFDPPTFDWTGCTGHYVMVLAKAGHIHLVNDSLAAWNIYSDTEGSFASAGFLEALLLTERPTFNPQGVYEYVFSAFAIGATTVVSEIRALRPYHILSMNADRRIQPVERVNPIKREAVRDIPVEDMAAYQRDRLEERFRAYAPLRDKEVISSISGGFDSRLMVSTFLQTGITPRLFVYGRDSDLDVICAKQIAAHLGQPLDHFDKNKQRSEHKPEKPSVEDMLYYFDGWKEDGLLGFDIDIQDRLARGRRGAFMANGKCGEIYRHYFYLRVGKRGMSTKSVVRAVFARPVPHVTTGLFNTRDYVDTIEKTFFSLAGYDGDWLYQDDLDYFYSAVRLGNAAGRDITVNHRFSHALYPFVEASLCGPAVAVPFDQKQHGRLQAHMIAQQDRGLAELGTSYGYGMLAGPGAKYRLKMLESYNRPAWIRHLMPRVKMRLANPLSAHQKDIAGFGMLEDQSFPYMQRFFHVDLVRDTEMASRVAALELLGQHFGFAG
ncbi:MAG: hypothetical protein EP335_07545 [Alphaproteobacteria bacterium]|nr:MAG: hypothetical protein EP335_07545 [Alphaproteobacteria bacterium]